MSVNVVRIFCAFLLVPIVFFGIGTGARAKPSKSVVAVTEVRMGLHGKRVRVVLESNGRLQASPFVLIRPYRVVLDLQQVKWHLPDGTGRTGKGFVSGYRYGQFRRDRDRMVFDLKAPAVVAKSFVIPPGRDKNWRYVLDLKRASAKAAEKMAREGKPASAPEPVQAAVVRPKGLSTARPRPRPQRPRKKVVVLDPGHGGIDPGATGRVKKSIEKNITLAMAKRLKKELLKTGRYKVVLTRERDVFVRLRGRIAKARAAGADLFISLHADSLDDRRVRGAAVYTLSEKASDKEAEALAAQENKADLIAGVDLSHNTKQVTDILIDLAQRETMNHSVRFARLLVSEMRKATRFLRKFHRFAGFAVLKAPDVPSVLVEMGYLSNAQDEAQLNRPRYQARLAKAITRGVDRYFAALQAAASP